MKSKEIKRFGNICCKTQPELKRYLYSVLVGNGYKPISQDGFIYAKGELPYLVTAHMDTVHKKQCRRYTVLNCKGEHYIQSSNGIGGDDRCGIYMIVRMILDGYRPTILFCEDEEIGSIGAGKFCKTEYIKDLDVRYMIELDRANANDAVFYDCDNQEFTEFIIENTGYKEAMGSWSDICELCSESKIAGVNLSCGYYNAHTTQEYVIFEEMINTLRVVEKLLRTESKQYEYIERVRYSTGISYKDWFSYYDVTYTDTRKTMSGMEILYSKYVYADKDGTYYPEDDYIYIDGKSEVECLGKFFMENPDVCFNDVLDYYPV